MIPRLLHHGLVETAQRSPESAAILFEDRRVTFGELDAASDNVAAALVESGVARGDRVALACSNLPEAIVSTFAVMKAGAVLVPVGPMLKRERLARILAECEVAAVIAESCWADVVRDAAGPVSTVREFVWTDAVPPGSTGSDLPSIIARPRTRIEAPRQIDQDLCLLLYTSGSTGEPKGAMLTHANLVNTTGAIAQYLGNVPQDVVLCALPLWHNYGLCQVLVGARVGYAVILERSFAYPFESMCAASRHRATGLPGVPAIFGQILQMPSIATLDLESLRYITNAAAPMPQAQLARLRERLPRVSLFNMYGMTECTRATYLDPARIHDKLASAGKAIPNCDAWVVDEQGRRAPPGVVGELVIRGANVMRGYWRQPEATARALVDDIVPGEKVLRTGDLFRTDEEGFLYFVGRRDDVFKCKGEKVSPREVEEVLYALPDVAEAAVVGIDNQLDGSSVAAYVVLRPGASLTEREIRRHCREKLESYKVPSVIETCRALPHTEAGKLDRRALAARAVVRVEGAENVRDRRNPR